jgi:hypothetical protein
MLNEYVNYLIENINKNNIHNEIDLVLDSGAFNGSYMVGCLLYLKSMEEKKLIKINRISGCSVGSFLAICFIFNKIDLAIKNGNKMIKFIRKTQDLTLLDKNWDTIIDEIIADFDVKMLENKLFMTYFDVKKKTQVVISKYKNKSYLKKILRKSIHIPYFIDKRLCYNNSMDGCYPFIFKERINKILFINLQTFSKIKNVFYIKNEKTILSRILTGILDIHNFYTNNSCDMCSYVNDWSISKFLIYRSRELVFVTLCYLINLLLVLKKYIPDFIEKDIYYNKILCVINNIYEDIIIYLTN